MLAKGVLEILFIEIKLSNLTYQQIKKYLQEIWLLQPLKLERMTKKIRKNDIVLSREPRSF